MKLAVFSRRGDTKIGAVLIDGLLYRYEEESAEEGMAESVFVGKVDRCMGGMEAAFVRVGKDRTVFLPYREMHGVPMPPPSGARVLVQIRRPPAGKKQAYATMDISLAGKYAVLTPVTHKKAVSSRYAESERPAALERMRRLCPDDSGLILRMEAAGADDAAIENEIAVLRAQWTEILRIAEGASSPGPVFARPPLEERLLRDLKGGADRILTDDASLLSAAGQAVEFQSGVLEAFDVASQAKKARDRVHRLPSGGSIVIDPCEAMTVVDVNTAGDAGNKKDPEKSRLKTNLEAAREIARLLQARDTGGIIIIDFIDMEQEENRGKVAAAMEEALREDYRKTVIHGFTSLGLMELTRKRG